MQHLQQSFHGHIKRLAMKKKTDKKRTAKKPEKAAIVLTRKRMFIWLSAVIGIAAWMFFLGVIVGRGTVPLKFDIEKLQEELISVKRELLEKEKEETKNVSEKPDLDFYATLTEKKKQARLKHVPPAPEKKKKDKFIVRQKPPSVKKTGRLTVQVASLKKSADAEKLIRRLQKKGYDAYKHVVQIPGKGTWNRICVGHFDARGEAQQLLTRLRNEDKFDPILVESAQGKE